MTWTDISQYVFILLISMIVAFIIVITFKIAVASEREDARSIHHAKKRKLYVDAEECENLCDFYEFTEEEAEMEFGEERPRK